LATKPEVPSLTFDAATGAEIPAAGAPLRLENSAVPAASPTSVSFAESVKGPFTVAANEERVVMFEDFANHASNTGLESVFTKPVADIYADVYAVPKAARPPVETYIPKPAIEAHVAEFDAGASRFMTESNLRKYGPAQRDGTAFVMPKAQADKLLADAGGDAAKFEEALGLPSGTLQTNPMVRVDIPHPRDLNVRMPRGTEAGANSQWLPGGYLPNGQIEAVVDLGVAKPGAYTTTPVVTGAPGANSTVVDAAANTVRAGSSRPAWLARLDAGNDFNAARSSAYPYNEVYIDSPKGSGYTRLDSYDPVAGEIISRKFTQLSSVQEKTAFNYINELPAKYPVNGKIANVPTSGSLAGQPLLGQHILEVPVQTNPIPQSVLDAANRAGVLIRDVNGHVH
jgi:hypothetical protein